MGTYCRAAHGQVPPKVETSPGQALGWDLLLPLLHLPPGEPIAVEAGANADYAATTFRVTTSSLTRPHKQLDLDLCNDTSTSLGTQIPMLAAEQPSAQCTTLWATAVDGVQVPGFLSSPVHQCHVIWHPSPASVLLPSCLVPVAPSTGSSTFAKGAIWKSDLPVVLCQVTGSVCQVQAKFRAGHAM